MVDKIEVKTEHKWRASSCGYDPADYCEHCGASNYQAYGTKFCEDYREAVIVAEQKKTRTHPPTEAAWEKLRTLLTQEEWDLLELYPKHSRKYREKDYILV